MSDLMRLAEAVERMTVPCREMDTLIHFLTNRKWIGRIPTWPPTKIERPAMESGLVMHIEGDGYFYGDDVLAYTASLDAALTLVPSGWQWMVKDFQGAAPAVAVLGDGLIVRNGATPALALAAACLSALTKEPKDD